MLSLMCTMAMKKRSTGKAAERGRSTRKRASRTFVSALIYPQAGGRTSAKDPRKDVAAEQLATIRDTLGLKISELAALFSVKRQAIEQWLANGVPLAHIARADRCYEVVEELAKRFKPQRLPAIVRGPMPILGDRSVLETLIADGPAAIFEFFYRWDSYVPDVGAILPGDFTESAKLRSSR